MQDNTYNIPVFSVHIHTFKLAVWMCHHDNFFYNSILHLAEIMIRKLFILGLILAVCLELSQGKPSLQAKEMEEYADALIQGMNMCVCVCVWIFWWYNHIKRLNPLLREYITHSSSKDTCLLLDLSSICPCTWLARTSYPYRPCRRKSSSTGAKGGFN